MYKSNIKSNAFLIIILVFTINCNSSKFDSKKWINGNERIRGKMAPEITKKKIILNKTRAEVIKILGNPDSQYKEKCIYYNLDMGHSIDWNYELQICFENKNDKVNYVQVND